jgi:hypothetical protein
MKSDHKGRKDSNEMILLTAFVIHCLIFNLCLLCLDHQPVPVKRIKSKKIESFQVKS